MGAERGVSGYWNCWPWWSRLLFINFFIVTFFFCWVKPTKTYLLICRILHQIFSTLPTKKQLDERIRGVTPLSLRPDLAYIKKKTNTNKYLNFYWWDLLISKMILKFKEKIPLPRSHIWTWILAFERYEYTWNAYALLTYLKCPCSRN